MIKQAEFIKSSTTQKWEIDEKSQFLLLGRSNVGKSSFINAITNRKSLARTSKTPGKTITLNYYLLNDNFYLVDAPGYGYAKRSKKQQDEFIEMLHYYLTSEPNLKDVFLFIDFKVGPTDLDIETLNFLQKLQKNVIIICTKYDKIRITKRRQQENLIKQKLKLSNNIFFISNETKQNINLIQNYLIERTK